MYLSGVIHRPSVVVEQYTQCTYSVGLTADGSLRLTSIRLERFEVSFRLIITIELDVSQPRRTMRRSLLTLLVGVPQQHPIPSYNQTIPTVVLLVV